MNVKLNFTFFDYLYIDNVIPVCSYMINTLFYIFVKTKIKIIFYSGLILYELHASLILAGRTKLQTDRKAGVSDLKLGLKYLKESLEILKTEPRGTLSYKIYQGGQESLSQVQQFVNSFL